MEYRSLGRTGWQVSTISFGAWAIGGSWGTVQDEESSAALHKAVEMGVNFFDTADVYGDGRSERLLGELKKAHQDEIIIASKVGRRLSPHTTAGYNRQNLTAFVERSLQNLQVEALDLVQLHCPPTAVYYEPEVFGILDDLVQQGKIRYYGASVEKVEEALKAIDYPNLQTIQIIFNIFRQRPADLFFREALRRQVGVIARLPLSSGMLAGKIRQDTPFEAEDHRLGNRQGAWFDRGETFSGVDFEKGLDVVEELKPLKPEGASLAQLALRWILMFEAVSCTIPGAKRPAQVEENVAAAGLPPLSQETMARIRQIYQASLYPLVHHYW